MYRTIREEVAAIIAEIEPGTEFTVKEIYERCTNYHATRNTISYAIRINPHVEKVDGVANTWRVLDAAA